MHFGPEDDAFVESFSTRDLALAAQRRIADLESALRFAEGYIMGAVPKLARDRNEAVAVVLPRIRAALYRGSAGNAGVPVSAKTSDGGSNSKQEVL